MKGACFMYYIFASIEMLFLVFFAFSTYYFFRRKMYKDFITSLIATVFTIFLLYLAFDYLYLEKIGFEFCKTDILSNGTTIHACGVRIPLVHKIFGFPF